MCYAGCVLMICVSSVLGSADYPDCSRDYLIDKDSYMTGAQSEVKKGQSLVNNGPKIVAKMFKKSRDFDVEKEVIDKLTDKLRNAPDRQEPWFPRVYSFCRIFFKEQWYQSIIMEDVKKRLFQAQKSLPSLVEKLRQLLSAVDELHEIGFTHNDLKKQNILMNGNDRIKVIDFGLAEHIGDQVESIIGTTVYVPPERILLSSYSSEVPRPSIDTAKLDSWSLGVIAFEFLTGTDLRDEKYKEMFECMKKAPVKPYCEYYARYFYFKQALLPETPDSEPERRMKRICRQTCLPKRKPSDESVENRFKTGLKKMLKDVPDEKVEDLWQVVNSLLQFKNDARSNVHQVLENRVFQEE